MTITIRLADERVAKLKQRADELGVTLEDVVQMLLSEAMDDSEIDENSPEFERELDSVMQKNAELYRRLA